MTRWAQLSGASQEVLVHWSQPQMRAGTTRGAFQILLPGPHPQNAPVASLSPSLMIYGPKTTFHHHHNCAHASPHWLTLLAHSQGLPRPAAPRVHCPVHSLCFFNPRQGSNRQPGPQSICENPPPCGRGVCGRLQNHRKVRYPITNQPATHRNSPEGTRS